jgi:hypothetical protein
LLGEKAVALLAAESEAGGIWVASAEGEARIWAEDGRIAYQPGTGDPLMLGRAWTATAREWL